MPARFGRCSLLRLSAAAAAKQSPSRLVALSIPALRFPATFHVAPRPSLAASLLSLLASESDARVPQILPCRSVDLLTESARYSCRRDVVGGGRRFCSTSQSEEELSAADVLVGEVKSAETAVDETNAREIIHTAPTSSGNVACGSEVDTSAGSGSLDKFMERKEAAAVANLLHPYPYLVSCGLASDVSPKLGYVDSTSLVQDSNASKQLNAMSFGDNIQMLRDRGFSSAEASVFLKKISLVKFGSLSAEKLILVLKFLESLRLEAEVCRALLNEVPFLVICDVEDDLWPKIRILETFGVDAREMVRKHPWFLLGNANIFKESIRYAEGLLEDSGALTKLLARNPTGFAYGRERIQLVVEFLESVGMTRQTALEIVIHQPYLLEVSIARFHDRYDFLKRKDLDARTICRLIEKAPEFFAANGESPVIPAITFLESQGISGPLLKRLLVTRPHVLGYSLEKTIVPKMEFLLRAGFQEKSATLKEALHHVLPCKLENLEARMNQLVELGLSYRTVCMMVRADPRIFGVGDDSFKEKVDFLLNTMQRSVQELASCPSFLCCSFERKIKPRFRVLSWLKQNGMLEKDFSLSVIATWGEQGFLNSFVSCHDSLFAIYKGAVPHVDT